MFFNHIEERCAITFLTQCISVWYNNATNQGCKALQRVVRLAEHISGSALPSLLDIYLKRCKSRAAKIIKDSNHPVTIFSFFFWQALQEHDGKNWETKEELLPSGHQAPKHKLSLITFTGLNLIISKTFIIPHHPHCCYVYIPGTTCLHIPLAHTCLYYYLLSPQYTVLHILLFICFYFIYFLLFIFTYIYIYSLVLCYIFCTVHWVDLTWFTFHYWLYSG